MTALRYLYVERNPLPDALVALDGDKVVGLVSWRHEFGGDTIALAWVDRAYRRRGIATTLVRKAQERVPGLMHSHDRNDDAEAWSASTGLPREERSEKSDLHRTRDQQGVDAARHIERMLADRDWHGVTALRWVEAKTAKASTSQRLYRGYALLLPSQADRDDFRRASKDDQADMVLSMLAHSRYNPDNLGVAAQYGMGMHWSTDEYAAERWAATRTGFNPLVVGVVVTAEHPGDEYLITDPAFLENHGVLQYGDEDEVTIKPGTSLRVVEIAWNPETYDADYVHQAVDVRKTAGQNGDLPEGLTLRHEVNGTWQIVHAYDGGPHSVGSLSWYKNGEILSVDVKYEYRRRGIATWLLEKAREIDPRVHHSTSLSDAGEAWSQTTGKTAAWNTSPPAISPTKYGEGYVARGLSFSGVSEAVGKKIVAGTVTARDILGEIGDVGIWWWPMGNGVSIEDPMTYAEGMGDQDYTLKGQYEDDSEQEWWDYGEIRLVIVAKSPKRNGEWWDPEKHNPPNGLMGNSNLDPGERLEVVEIMYDAGWGWKALPAQGIQVTAGPAGGRIPSSVKARPPSDLHQPRPVKIDRKAGEDIEELEPDERALVIGALKRLERGIDPTIEAKHRPPLVGCFSLDVTASMRVLFYLHVDRSWHVFAVLPDHDYDEAERRMRNVAALERKEYEGTVGDRSHITCSEVGTVPTSVVATMSGVKGEVPGEHRNRLGEKWEAFKADIAANGITEPIFITVDYGEEPKISEGNHRRDAAVELGLDEVPVEIRYFGHAERMNRVAAYLNSTGGTIYRGLRVAVPATFDEALKSYMEIEEKAERRSAKAAKILLDTLTTGAGNRHSTGLGIHWTERPEFACGAAAAGGTGTFGELRVVIEATYTASDVVPEGDDLYGLSAVWMDSRTEAEVLIKPGAQLTITGVWVPSDQINSNVISVDRCPKETWPGGPWANILAGPTQRAASKYTVFVGWGARTPEGPAGLTPDSHGRVVRVEAESDTEAIMLATQMVNSGGTNPITSLLPDGFPTSAEILSMEAAWNPSEHPRGQPENAGQFRSTDEPAFVRPPKDNPLPKRVRPPVEKERYTGDERKARGDVYDHYMAAGKYAEGDPRNDPGFERMEAYKAALSERYVGMTRKRITDAIKKGASDADVRKMWVKYHQDKIDRDHGIGGDTEERYDRKINPDTGARDWYRPARNLLHNQILDMYEEKAAKVPRAGKCLIMAGPSGAGKSTFLKKYASNTKDKTIPVDDRLDVVLGPDGKTPTNYVVINPDDFKDYLPVDAKRYPGLNSKNEVAGIVHEESSFLAKRAVRMLMSQGVNVILDVTLADADKALKQYVTPYQDNYQYECALVDGDMKMALSNAGNRYKQPDRKTGQRQWSGRFVPMRLVLGQAPTKPGFRSRNAEQFAQFIATAPVATARIYDPYSKRVRLVHADDRHLAALSAMLRVGRDTMTHQTTDITRHIQAFRDGAETRESLVHYLTLQVQYVAPEHPYEPGSDERYHWVEGGTPYVPGSFDEVTLAVDTGLLPRDVYQEVLEAFERRSGVSV